MLLSKSTISSPNPIIISVFLCEHDWLRTTKYPNTNMQIQKHKYANTNTQIQIQICKYKNTNTQIREWVLWYKALHIRGRSCHSRCRERRQAQSLEASPCLVTSKCKWQWWGLTKWWWWWWWCGLWCWWWWSTIALGVSLSCNSMMIIQMIILSCNLV